MDQLLHAKTPAEREAAIKKFTDLTIYGTTKSPAEHHADVMSNPNLNDWQKLEALLEPARRSVQVSCNMEKDYGTAWKRVNETIQKYPQAYWFHMKRGELITGMFDAKTPEQEDQIQQEALREFTFVIGNDPNRQSEALRMSLGHRARRYVINSMYEEALRDLAGLEAAGEKLNPSFLFWRAKARLGTLDIPGALADLEEVRKAHDIPPVRYHIGEAKWLQGDVAQGKAERAAAIQAATAAKSEMPEPTFKPAGPALRAIIMRDTADMPGEAALLAGIRKRFPDLARYTERHPPKGSLFGLAKGKPVAEQPGFVPETAFYIGENLIRIELNRERNVLQRGDECLRSARWCQDPWALAGKRQSHIVLSVEDATDRMAALQLLLTVTDAVLVAASGFAVVLPTAQALLSPEMFRAQAPERPLALLVALKFGRDPVCASGGQPARWYRTQGLEALGYPEAEVRSYAGDPMNAGPLLLGFAHYITTTNAQINDGEVFHHDGPGAAKPIIRIGPSTLVPGRDPVYRLEMPV
jgi:hypothetical protein